jgi:CheY-like chemotaxis protein
LARKILLADDSVTAQNMGRRILTDAGYEVTTVNNGSAALKKIAELKPDLIVLDVYMPGYGGLEVCQRIRENKETAQLPILLTVGKLEPFKPDEARRVRADAFIVKPFDPSELLTALTKLEDRIVPKPEAFKPGRFAKAIAALEQSSSDSFGDKETGWKDRLNIPHPPVKSSDPEPEPEPARSIKTDPDRELKDPGKGAFERPIPAGLPADITPEEIAAITAAAAALKAKDSEAESAEVKEHTSANEGMRTAESPEASAPSTEPETSAQEIPATFASAFQDQAEREPVAEAEEQTVAKAETTETVEVAKAEESKAEEPVVAPSAAAESVPNEPVVDAVAKPAEEGVKPDVDVMAAIAALGNISDADDSREAHAGTETDSARSAQGPRWVAESISVSSDESTFILEQEMEKAYAAFAAAEGARAAMAAGGSSTDFGASSSVAVAEAAAVDEAPARVEQPEEMVAATEAVVAPVTEQQRESTSEPVAVEAVAQQEVPTVADAPEPKEEAFAAAAGAMEAVSVVTSSGADTAVVDAGEQKRESELAAAWANWKQIRETILQPQAAPQETQEAAHSSVEPVAQEVEASSDGPQPEVAATPAEVSTPQEAAATAAEPEAVAATSVPESTTETHEPEAIAEATEVVASAEGPSAEDSSKPDETAEAISSVVDEMLAELKPKLMKELSKKLKKGKR